MHRIRFHKDTLQCIGFVGKYRICTNNVCVCKKRYVKIGVPKIFRSTWKSIEIGPRDNFETCFLNRFWADFRTFPNVLGKPNSKFSGPPFLPRINIKSNKSIEA